ncbi:MAG TPA: hypothetical protein VFC44_01975, partial [Candidatus Saccharimonadales bacterium]|nr:hypothetical protein [Candidatus Saccharimonadales bacterium]
MNKNETFRLKMMSGLAVAIIGWLCWNGAITGRAQSASNLSPQLQEVVKLTQAHMSDDVILAYIHNSGAAYSLSADNILYLNNQGVSQPVLSALLQSKPSAVSTPTTPAPPVGSAPQVPPPAPFGQAYAPSAPAME